MREEDLAAWAVCCIANLRAGLGLRKGKRVKERELLGRGPATLWHSEIPDIEARREDVKAQSKEREARILARFKAAKKKKAENVSHR